MLLLQTYVHLFYECKVTKAIWESILKYFRNNEPIVKGTHYFPSKVNFLFNTFHSQQDHYLNLSVLIFKYKVYANCFQNDQITVNSIIDEIQFIKKIELKNVKTIKQIKMYNHKWKTNLNLALPVC